MAGGLELDDLAGPFQPKPFHDSRILWILAIHFAELRHSNKIPYDDSREKPFEKGVGLKLPMLCLGLHHVSLWRGGKPSDLLHKAQTKKKPNYLRHFDWVSLKCKDLSMRMVFILSLHKLDMTKYFKSLSAAVPCNLPTVLNIKSSYLCRPNQNNGLKTKDAVYLVKLCQGGFAQWSHTKQEYFTIYASFFSILFLQAGTSLTPKLTYQKTLFQQWNEHFTSISTWQNASSENWEII